MIRAGIMSMQRISNYGSVLQAYALKKMLEKSGCDVEFVDYHVGEPIVRYFTQDAVTRKIRKFNEAFRVQAPFLQTVKYLFYKKNFSESSRPFLGLSEEMNYQPKLDLLVIGSDEVFNCLQDNPNVGFSPELFGRNNRARTLISYAASFGNTTTIQLINHGVFAKVRKWVREFDGLSVRDENSQNVIRDFGTESDVHLDPVLTYDFRREMELPFRKPDYRYLIVYGYTGRFTEEECEKIRGYADEKGLKIVNLGGIQQCCDEFVDCSPELVIRWFMHADCVVTDTFHGAILSVITERPFAVCVRTKGYGNSEKLTDLLRRLCLEERRVEEDFGEVLETPINWEPVREIIREYRIKAEQYIAYWVHEAENRAKEGAPYGTNSN